MAKEAVEETDEEKFKDFYQYCIDSGDVEAYKGFFKGMPKSSAIMRNESHYYWIHVDTESVIDWNPFRVYRGLREYVSRLNNVKLAGKED